MESASIAFCFEALRHCYNILGKERFRAETEYIMKLYQDVDKSKVSSVEFPLVEEVAGNSLKNLVIEAHSKSLLKNEVIVEKPVDTDVSIDAKNKKKSKADKPEPSQSLIEKPDVCQTVSGKPEPSQSLIEKPDVCQTVSGKPETSQTKQIKTQETPAKWKRTPLPDEVRCQRILSYNGEQCTFKKDEGLEFCPRHKNK